MDNENRLAQESSPYLLQHAHNPVNWYPWSEEAFDKARQEDKPVFLSIGYATCHWCHVMAHESFEDREIAALMNDTFINIKVDREERPDIDNTYMLVCQMLSGSGGWPLNVVLTPDKKPFYAATYIPKTGRHGRPGMRELIPWISQLWQNEREKISTSADNIIRSFQQSSQFEIGNPLGVSILEEACSQFEETFDEQYGGFGTAPKFPSPHNLMLLLRHSKHFDDRQALHMAEQTLLQMRRGGLFDHVGLGFHRYSTDREWLLPHFEKMLYDQAMLLMAYTEGWQCTGRPLFERTAKEIISYITRKMRHPDGGYYSAEDADSEGEEGKFYVWTPAEIRAALPAAEAELALEVFNITPEGNYREEATGKTTGKSIPHLRKSFQDLATERNMEVDELNEHLDSIRKQLLQARRERVAPLLDDKILTDWNGLAIAALAKAGRAFEDEQYIRQAESCYQFLSEKLIPETGGLLHRFRNGESGIEAHADDYAFLIWGLIELHQTTLESSYLARAVELNDKFIDLFWDPDQGGFFFTSRSAEKLLGRKKEIYDGALPSSNSVAMINLLRLARLTGNTEYEELADTLNKLFASDIGEAPTGFGCMLHGIDFITAGSREIVIAGHRDRDDTRAFLQALNSLFLPNTVILLNDPADKEIGNVVPFLSDFPMQKDCATAYVCQNYHCEQPTTDPEIMMQLLEKGS
ncbi:thioredoxin domain-containing protein [Fodinibius sediminis]|uniref:Spermatogenesis-associated protein 20-like TRX domain-containing protein n=1 Tax=Fodinibius sediminis TaxID=1214077 RepID=A0A521E0G2_9BACT|nr:thioredoxin domain-containing protein [Fodinibius sediminis]SMO77459.1 hypothetical protein SAMN06265218_112147 [Fodinibius sediminis]